METNVKSKKKSEWQLQEANAMFSEVIKAAVLSPQVITVRGKETAVILSYQEYQKLSRPGQTLFEFIQSSPLRDQKLELPKRQSEKMRSVSL
jgi:prevent-host-death family protein